MTRPPVDQALWQPWIDHVCSAMGVDPALVDARAIHDLTGEVARVGERPMAPVSAHLWGVAVGAGADADAAGAALLDAARDAARGGGS